MAGRRPGVQERPLDLHPLHGQPRPFVILGADLLDSGRGDAQPLRDDAERVLGLEGVHEFHLGRLVVGDVVVAHQVLLGDALHAAGQDIEGGLLAGILITVGGNLDAVLARKLRRELPDRDADVGRDPGAEDREASIVQFAIDIAARMLVLDGDALVENPGPWPAGDGRVEGAVGRFEVALHQERGRVERLAHIVEAVRR